jgi:hypothetical protein
MCKITIAGTSCAIFNIQNMPFKPQNKILIHHIQTKKNALNIIYARGKPRAALFQPMRFFKKNPPVESYAKNNSRHGTSLAIYNTEACTFRYMMNIMILIDIKNK